jgi:tryptophan synthase alpha chain
MQTIKINQAFGKGTVALMPYFTIGYPNYGTSLDVIEACVHAGADLIELGIPFSDPLADGPTIQNSMQASLNSGTTVQSCLDAVNALRARGVKIPLVLMGYINPILSYGLEEFAIQAARAGASGFIIPDLPPEEAGELQNLCNALDLDLVFMLPPNSAEERIQYVAQQSQGFVYLVSVTGTTGARQALPAELAEFVKRVRGYTDKPLAVGFGISTPQQAAEVGQIADGVIVGSALLKTVGQASEPVKEAGDFVRALKEGLIAPIH